MFKSKKKRGQIGAIGDDFPSIFPIVFGVLIFVGTMVYALNQVQQRNDYLNLEKSTLSLSNVVMESGYTTDAGFASACTSTYIVTANRQGINAIITVKKFCPTSMGGLGSVNLSSNIFDVQGINPSLAYDPSAGLYCSSAPNNAPNYYAGCAGNPNFLPNNGCPQNFEVLNFPIAVDCAPQQGNIVGVGMVNVIGWT
jgi:hypothetical protein